MISGSPEASLDVQRIRAICDSIGAAGELYERSGELVFYGHSQTAADVSGLALASIRKLWNELGEALRVETEPGAVEDHTGS